MRCFSETGFTCAKAYFMPCTPNYDREGNVIEGQEMACPEKFRWIIFFKGIGFNPFPAGQLLSFRSHVN